MIHARGFTIIEMLVAVALFAIVMIISVGALLSLVTANRKAQALQSVMNNLNVTLDGMVRAIREGTLYHCDNGSGGPITAPRDCTGSGGTRLAFESYGGQRTNPNDQFVYEYIAPSGTTEGYIRRSVQGGTAGSWVQITAPEVSITNMAFYVIGSDSADLVQPKVVIVIKGVAGGVNTKITSTFHIQSTAVQRVLDIP